MWWATLYLPIVLALGYGLSCWCVRERQAPVAWLAGVSLLLGLAATGLLLFWISLAGLPPTRAVMAGLAALGVALLATAAWRHRLVQPLVSARRPRWRWWHWLAAALLLAYLTHSAAVVAINALGHNNFNWDGYMLWGLKARAVSTAPVRVSAYFQRPDLAPLHQNYPLLAPFLMAGVNALTGRLEETASKLPFLLLYLGLAALLWSECRRYLGPLAALGTLALIAGLPALVQAAGTSCADVPLAALVFGTVVFLLRWQETGDWRHLAPAAVFAAAAVFTKNEGLGLLGPLTLALVAAALAARRRGRLLPIAVFLASVALLSLPWLCFRQALPGVDENYPARLTWSVLAGNAGRVTAVLLGMGRGLFLNPDTGFLWPLVALFGVLAGRRAARPDLLLLWVFLLGHLGLYAVIYVISPADPVTLMPVTLNRLLLHAAPAGSLILVRSWAVLNAATTGAAPPALPQAASSSTSSAPA